MQFRLLGPLEVYEGGRRLELGGGRQRALLALLLLHRNEIVPGDRLIEALWSGSPPPTATSALHKYVSQLRAALGRERIRTTNHGYQLRIGDDELDLAQFEQLVGEAKFLPTLQDRAARLARRSPSGAAMPSATSDTKSSHSPR